MDAYDCEQADKEMSRRYDEIFKDPSRHKFYSVFQADQDEARCGPRGGKIRGRKTICAFCGHKKSLHAETTEHF